MSAGGLPIRLEATLREFVHAGARSLSEALAGGAEVELELRAQRGRGTPLYSYEPLTGAFIAEHEGTLARLPEHEAALNALAAFDGLDRYLGTFARGAESRREPSSLFGPGKVADTRASLQTRAREALKRLIEDAFCGQTDFELRPERLTAALARMQRAQSASAGDAVWLVATLRGLAIASAEITLTRGLTIASPAALGSLPRPALAGAESMIDGGEPGHLFVVYTCGDPTRDLEERANEKIAASPAELALARGREVLKDLLRALRMYGDAHVTLGPLAWARTGSESTWIPLALGVSGRPDGLLILSCEQEDELRAFCNLVSRRAPHRNELAWALQRFELGCERASAYEGLTDHLLALRALLEPEGPASGLLASRIAALCATPQDRAKVSTRMTKAQALERAIVAGSASESAPGRALAADVAEKLRSLLRDVICGHLSPELARVADEMLAEPAAHETRRAPGSSSGAARPLPVGAVVA